MDMKNVIVLLLAFCLNGYSQIINFPDPNFKNALVKTKCVDTDGDGFGDADVDFNNDGEIDVNEAILIKRLIVNNQLISKLEGIQHFKSLSYLNCYKNQIKSLELSGLTNLAILYLGFNDLQSLNLSGMTNLRHLHCDNNQIVSLNLTGLANLKSLHCDNNLLSSLNLSEFTKLETLNCSSNQLPLLNLSGLLNLKLLYCDNNKFLTLNLTGLPNLEYINCSYNQIPSLNLSGLLNLKLLYCNNNQLTNLNLSGLTKLEDLDCSSNQLSLLILSALTKLEYLDCSSNQLPYLNALELSNLDYINCSKNLISSVNLSGLTNLEYVDCSSNELKLLNIKGISNNHTLHFRRNPNLTYICCNLEKIQDVKNKAKSYGNNCEVNSYCTFTPGGKYYILNGNTIWDKGLDGCDDLDSDFKYMKFESLLNGNLSGVNISNSSGRYSIPVFEGTLTLLPILEHPDHFEVTPTTFTVTFPSTSDTITQNFCITPKGILRQTNITVIPLSPPARPGFDASYKIVWENAGNQIESGTLNFTYDETLLDYISATQTAAQIADGIVKWNFTNLLPFEKKEITVTLKVNRPTDTPTVNAGDKLYLTASILDNIFTLENTVVGSYDPNDKTCLQGDRVKPDMVGKYVDYLIRFENTGNYAAENVVIKDIIDTKTFDVSSLQITDASHEVYTRIEGNKVEFIFENIQLPFDDANNDGYVAFKIKTLPTLVLGDSLKNLADIYFDYNFPIRTNEAQTTIALPSFTKDIATEVNVYPNPVRDILYLESDENWSKAEIFDISGRILRSVSLFNQSIDVNGLESGTYFMRLKDEEKVGVVKFVKM